MRKLIKVSTMLTPGYNNTCDACNKSKRLVTRLRMTYRNPSKFEYINICFGSEYDEVELLYKDSCCMYYHNYQINLPTLLTKVKGVCIKKRI